MDPGVDRPDANAGGEPPADERVSFEAPVARPVMRAAMRRARIENADRSESVSELRSAEHARLDMLRDRVAAVLAEVPGDCDMFDLGLSPGERPRLFIDMIAFVEMAHDKRAYRFVQDTRHGRVVVAESEGLETMTRVIAEYVARRLVEREKALAADAIYRAGGRQQAPAAQAFASPPPTTQTPTTQTAPVAPVQQSVAPPRARPTGLRVFARAFMFLIEVIGSAAFFGLLAAAGYWLWLKYGG